MGWQLRKSPQSFSHEVSNSMVFFSRIHLRVSSLSAFLFWRHTVLYPLRRFFANNSIYKKAKSLISFRTKSSRFSRCVCHISCFLVAFEGSFQINGNVLPNFKYKWQNFHESIFKHMLTFLVLNFFISFISFCYFFKEFGTHFQKAKVYIGTENFSS